MKLDDLMLVDNVTCILKLAIADGRFNAEEIISLGQILKRTEKYVVDDSTPFWTVLESLRSVISARRTRAIEILNILLTTSTEAFNNLMLDSYQDRSYGFKYMCRSLLILYKGATSPEERSLITEIISEITLKAYNLAKLPIYHEFIDTLYESLSDESMHWLIPFVHVFLPFFSFLCC